MNLKTGVMAAKNSALPSQVYITFETLKIEEKLFNLIFTQYCCFYSFFYQRNVLMSIRDYIKNIKKPY